MVKTVMQLGATIGRTFSYALLQAVTVLDEATLQHGLEQLVQAELLFQRGVGAQATYMFKHALIQDASYQSLLKSTRQQYHQRIAQRLEAQWPETVVTEPELAAHHYTAAGLSVPAVTYWQRAGQRALQRSACVEAINHLTMALELLTTLPDTPERRHQELEVYTTLGPALIATKGYAAPDVERAYTRARALCQQVGETPQLFPVLWGLWAFYFVRGEFQTGRELGEQCLALAQRTQDSALLLEAHLALGAIVLRQGEVASARAHLEQGVALYDPQQHRSHAFRYGQDPGVACLSDATYALWLLGYPDQAVQRSHKALTLAQELSHPASMAFALCFAAWLQQHRREIQATRKWAEAAMTLATEQGFALFLAQATVLYGWTLAEQGQEAEGIAQMRQGLDACRATGAELFQPYYLALLAEAHGKVGKTEEGLRLLAEAMTAAEKTGERVYEAELYRVKGELLLWQAAARGATPTRATQAAMFVGDEPSGGTEIEACFRQALALARRQQARSLELRTAMSLGRLWQQHGKRDAARQLLGEVYAWFTEGFDTADVQEARVLLEAWV
jgi:predicted ATPase